MLPVTSFIPWMTELALYAKIVHIEIKSEIENIAALYTNCTALISLR